MGQGAVVHKSSISVTDAPVAKKAGLEKGTTGIGPVKAIDPMVIKVYQVHRCGWERITRQIHVDY